MVEISSETGAALTAYVNEFHRRRQEFRDRGDAERLAMVEMESEGFGLQESDPESSYAVFTRARDEARRLNEPWWEVFFENWRLGALTSFISDYNRAVPLAMELMAKMSSPPFVGHEIANSIMIDVLYAYICSDPFGMAQEITEGLAYLDSRIPRGVDAERHVLLNRERSFLIATERWIEGEEQALRSLSLAEQEPHPRNVAWYGAWIVFGLCEIQLYRRNYDSLSRYADRLMELSIDHGQLKRTISYAHRCHAVVARARGNEKEAAKRIRMGSAALRGVDCSDSWGVDPLVFYYELSEEWNKAVSLRDRELSAMRGKGELHAECKSLIDRCRLLARAGRLRESDLQLARDAAARMRKPEWHLAKLAAIERNT